MGRGEKPLQGLTLKGLVGGNRYKTGWGKEIQRGKYGAPGKTKFFWGKKPFWAGGYGKIKNR